MEVQGKLFKKFDATEHGGSFKKIEFVVELDDKYPQLVKMQAVQDKVSLIESMPVGTVAEFFFNLKGREWTNSEGKVLYFTNVEVWKVKTIEEVAVEEPESEEKGVDMDGDELPF
jgi:hypothetical protein